MFPQFLLDSDDDWQEGFRRYWYPRFHSGLLGLGKVIGVPMYAVGSVGYDQYVGTLDEAEEAIEAELVDLGFRRNPLAAYKTLPDGRRSEGSWVLLNEDAPDFVAPGMQLHVTLFKRDDGKPGRVVYAHYEDDWRSNATAHLRAANFSAAAGVDIARDYLNTKSFLVLHIN